MLIVRYGQAKNKQYFDEILGQM